MLFKKSRQVVKRILIVEDEPLTAFDNERTLGDAGYEVVATVNDVNEALNVLDQEEVHLLLSEVRLKEQQTGLSLALHARERGVPTLFATASSCPGASKIAVGYLLKPFNERQLIRAIESVDRHLLGKRVRPQKGLELFVILNEAGLQSRSLITGLGRA